MINVKIKFINEHISLIESYFFTRLCAKPIKDCGNKEVKIKYTIPLLTIKYYKIQKYLKMKDLENGEIPVYHKHK